MNKRVIALFAIVVVTISVSSQALSQSRCSLTDATAPSVRGLRLGMSTQDLLALFPGTATRWAKDPKKIREDREKAMAPTSSEPVSLGFEPATDAAIKDQFAGVESVAATVVKGRVVEFNIQYGGATWRTVDEWVARVSETLKLPGKENWVIGRSEHPNKVLRCDGIEIEAGIQGGGASIRETNTSYLNAIEEQGKAAEEKKRRESKP